MKKFALLLFFAGFAVGCQSSSSYERVTLQELADPYVEVDPERVAGVDLLEVAPAPDLTFCEAFAAAPSRWLTDAVVPVQLWRDSFVAVRAAPAQVQQELDILIDFADRMLDRHLGRLARDARPEFDAAMAKRTKHLADVAVDVCPDLPLLLGQSIGGRQADPWTGVLDELSEAEVAGRCGEDAARVQSGIDLYLERYGEVPRHLEQVEAGLYFDGWFGSDVFGIALGTGKAAAISSPLALPGGPCESV